MSLLNLWDRREFQMAGLGKKCKPLAWLTCLCRNIKFTWQRATRGYADCDVHEMGFWLQALLPVMLEDYRDNRHGSPACLGKNVTDENGMLVNPTCHEEWTEILDKMIFYWKESNEETCSRKNPYEEEHTKAFSEFTDKYGLFGEKLQTPEELEASKKHGGCTMHFMHERPEYAELDKLYMEQEQELEQYRLECKDKAMDLLKEYLFYLWS